MYIAFIVLIFIASILLILAVLAQNPKGGMAANFGVSNQVMGVRQTADFLEKSSWGLAIAILVLSLAATMTMPKENIARSRTAVENALLENIETSGEGVTDNETMEIPAETTETEPTEDIPAE